MVIQESVYVDRRVRALIFVASFVENFVDKAWVAGYRLRWNCAYDAG